MTVSRRVHLAVAIALVAMSSVVLAPSALASPECTSFTDAAGDAAPMARPELRDPALDVTTVRYSVEGEKLRVEVTVAQYADRPTLAWAHAFQSEFRAPRYGPGVMFTYSNSPSRDVEGVYFKHAWITVDGEFVEGSDRAVTSTVRGNVVTLALPVAFLEHHVGPMTGEVITPRETRTYGMIPGPYGNRYDVAKPNPGTVFTVAPCVSAEEVDR